MYGSYLQEYLNRTQAQPTVAPTAAPAVKVPANSPVSNPSGKKPYLEVNDTIDIENKVKPDKGQGHLIHDTIKDKIKYFGFDRKYDAKALVDGYSGKAKDHQLGRLNDVGLVAGGLAIAGFIAASKQTAKAKIMEFVGLGSFLLAMKVWPKVAIEMPAKLVHGFNVNKQYIDDQGRKKSVFQDSQYIPWDLYTGERPDENISLIGDKMGIKKDIPNRDEVVKDQMRKVATQNNALWMLSAGVATPVLGALGACGAEKLIDDRLEIRNNEKANSKIKEMSRSLDGVTDTRKASKAASDKISGLLNGKQGAAVDEAFVDSLTDAVSDEIKDAKLIEGVRSDLGQMLKPGNPVLNGEAKNKILTDLASELEKLNLTDKANGKIQVNEIIPSMEELNARLQSAFGKSFSESMEIASEGKANQVSEVIEVMIQDKLYDKLPEKEIEKVTGTVRKVATGGLQKSAAKLTADKSNLISSYLKEVLKFQETHKGLDECMQVKVGETEGSVLAKNWQRTEKALFKALGITDKELKAARLGRLNSEELIAKKLEILAAPGNEENYKKALDTFARSVDDLDVRLHGTEKGKSMLDSLFEAVDKNYELTEKRIGSIAENSGSAFGESKFVEALTERHFNGAGSHKNAYTDWAKERISSVKSTYQRMINAFDVFKRAHDIKPNDKVGADAAAKVKEIVLNAHAKDFSEKFFTDNNLNFYKKIYDFMCGETSEATEKVLTSVSPFMNGKFDNYKSRLRNYVGNDENKIKTKHVLEDIDKAVKNSNGTLKRSEATPNKIFNMIGKSPSEFLKDAAQKSYNSNKWLRTFGAIGAGVFALTLAAQFAFGGKDDAIKEVK